MGRCRRAIIDLESIEGPAHSAALAKARPRPDTPHALRCISRASALNYTEVVLRGAGLLARSDLALLCAQAARKGLTTGFAGPGAAPTAEGALEDYMRLGLRLLWAPPEELAAISSQTGRHPILTVLPLRAPEPECYDAEPAIEARQHSLFAEWNAEAADFVPLPPPDRAHVGACSDCARFGRCPGLHLDDARPPKPFRREAPAGNAFVYRELSGHPDPGDAVPCALVRSTLDADLAAERLLYLRRDNGTLGLYYTDSGDFGDAEIARTRDALGQLYADVRHGDAPITDFSRDLRVVRREPACDDCPARPTRCPGRWRSERDDVFGEVDRPLAALLAKLEGAVLDIGSGPVRYAQSVRARIEAGHISVFHTLDPFVEAPDPPLGEPPAVRHFMQRAEDFDAGEQRYDVVLVLRAWNHLEDIPAAMRALVRCLKPGGRMVIADNAAYGLVPRATLATRPAPRPGADVNDGPGIFEHFRNHESHQALARLEAIEDLGLELETHEPIVPGAGNQWLLGFRRR